MNLEDLLFYPQMIEDYYLHWGRKTYPASETTIRCADGKFVHGWFIQRHLRKPKPLLIYFGGNAEEVTTFLYYCGEKHFSQYALGFFNYRGYGLSLGKPNQQTFFFDALSIYDFLSTQCSVDSQRIYVMGRSLGSGVATYLASQRPVKGVILISPYDSIKSLAEERYPFFIENGDIERNAFESTKYAPTIKSNALALVGLKDTLISPQHSQNLIDQWGGEIKTVTFANADHETIMDEPQLWEEIDRFIK